jgi:branched-chain amino acid transport system permease protein
VALGALIIINIVFFQQGILGWAQEKWPERFGIVVEDQNRVISANEDLEESAVPPPSEATR